MSAYHSLSLNTNTNYYCRTTVTIENTALDTAVNGINGTPGTGSGTLTFGVAFYSTATSVEVNP